jgi:DNA-directed RNA polymerase specialized sigma24 family protein
MIGRADIWQVAGDVLTDKQLRILELRERHGFSWRQIAYMVNVDVSTVRGHYNAAIRKIHNHLEHAQKEPA